MRIDSKTLVLVADGQAATFFRNRGSGDTIELEPLHGMGLHNEANRDLANDRPGHAQVGMSERRTSYEQNDLHQANETAFLKGMLELAPSVMSDNGLSAVILIAEPKALGVIRAHADDAFLSKVSMQIDKDYTKTAIPALEAILRQI